MISQSLVHVTNHFFNFPFGDLLRSFHNHIQSENLYSNLTIWQLSFQDFWTW